VAAAGPFTVLDPADGGVAESDAYGLVIDAVGGKATRVAASDAVMPGGVIVHIGLMDNDGGLDVRKLTLQEVTFVGTYTYTMVDFRATVDAIYSGRLGDLGWIDRRELKSGAAAFDDLEHGRSAASKIVLVP
jgi:L-iditol 2-dehydrogenase